MSVKENVIMKNKKYKLVPPDGGYGYIIFLSAIINLSTTIAFGGCFGIIFDDFIKEIGMSSTSVTMVTGIYAMSLAIGGFLTNCILMFISMRKLGFMAAALFNFGVFGTVFTKSIPVFFVCQGVMQGLGAGILYNLTCTIINDYFLQKRIFAVSFVQTVSALSSMVAPMFVKWCLGEYGYRGTLLIITGISSQNFSAVALMQPVQWHMKKIEIVDKNEMQILLVDERKGKEVGNTDVPTVKLTDVECSAVEKEEKVYDLIKEPKKNSVIMRVFENIVDVEIGKKLIVSCVAHGPAIAVFADITYTLILPQALYEKGWSQYSVALTLSIYAFGDLVTRTVLIFTSKWLNKVGTQEIYVIGLAIACLSRLVMMWTQNPILIYTCLYLMGGCRSTITVLIPLVLSDVVSEDKFTSAIGTYLLLNGIVNLLLGPAVGAIRDLTKSYSVAFYILTSCYAIIVLFWSIELCYKRNKLKRIRRQTNLESSRSIKK